MEIPICTRYVLNTHAMLSALLGRKIPATHTGELFILYIFIYGVIILFSASKTNHNPS